MRCGRSAMKLTSQLLDLVESEGISPFGGGSSRAIGLSCGTAARLGVLDHLLPHDELLPFWRRYPSAQEVRTTGVIRCGRAPRPGLPMRCVTEPACPA